MTPRRANRVWISGTFRFLSGLSNVDQRRISRRPAETYRTGSLQGQASFPVRLVDLLERRGRGDVQERVERGTHALGRLQSRDEVEYLVVPVRES